MYCLLQLLTVESPYISLFFLAVFILILVPKSMYKLTAKKRKNITMSGGLFSFNRLHVFFQFVRKLTAIHARPCNFPIRNGTVYPDKGGCKLGKYCPLLAISAFLLLWTMLRTAQTPTRFNNCSMLATGWLKLGVNIQHLIHTTYPQFQLQRCTIDW